jgi:hypothetical protein
MSKAGAFQLDKDRAIGLIAVATKAGAATSSNTISYTTATAVYQAEAI